MWNHSQLSSTPKQSSSSPSNSTVLNNFVSVLSSPKTPTVASSLRIHQYSTLDDAVVNKVSSSIAVTDNNNNYNGSLLAAAAADVIVDLTTEELPSRALNVLQKKMFVAVCEGRRMNKGSRQRHAYSFKFKRSAIGLYDEYVLNNHPSVIDATGTQCGAPYAT